MDLRTIQALRDRLDELDEFGEVEVGADTLRELIDLALCEVRRRADRTVQIRTLRRPDGTDEN